jgi:hypothetical protein
MLLESAPGSPEAAEAAEAAPGFWFDAPLPARWSEELRMLLIREVIRPPRAARYFAILHVAMHDAAVLAKLGARKSGSTAKPSVRAAMCGAAGVVFEYLFPRAQRREWIKARHVASLEVKTHRATAQSVQSGFALGMATGQALVERARQDLADQPPSPFAQTPDAWWVAAPMEPTAGTWKPWLLQANNQFRPAPPAAMTSPEATQTEFAEVASAVQQTTPYQKERAVFWNFDVPSILWDDIAREALVRPRSCQFDDLGSSLVLTLLHVTLADAFIATWEAKYAIRRKRPDMVAPPGSAFKPLVVTPAHPSFPSGHAAASRAAAMVLGEFFPEQATSLLGLADEATSSRLWAGIHFRSDNEAGAALGKSVAEFDRERAGAEGWVPRGK